MGTAAAAPGAAPLQGDLASFGGGRGCKCKSRCYAFPPQGYGDPDLPLMHLRWCKLDAKTVPYCLESNFKVIFHHTENNEPSWFSTDICTKKDEFNCHCLGHAREKDPISGEIRTLPECQVRHDQAPYGWQELKKP